MKIAILGGGFGLYGYLPALAQIPNSTIILPNQYQDIVKARNDIKHFYDVIEWVSDEEKLLKDCDGIIIARTPKQQYQLVQKALKHKNINYFFVEKPLSFSPETADDLLNKLKSSNKKFRIGFNFRYTNWGRNLLKNSQNLKSISWNFRAHHYAQNIQTWKRQHEDGGGALRFYGIHLIAILAEIGYNDAAYSKIISRHEGEAESWEAELTGPDLTPCKIIVASNNDETNFSILQDGHNVQLQQPFQTIEIAEQVNLDQRVSFLKTGLTDLFNQEQAYYNWYDQANLLWRNIEKRNIFL